MIDQGQIVLNDTIENIAAKHVSVEVAPESLASARSRKPIYERANLAGAVMIFEDHPTPIGNRLVRFVKPAWLSYLWRWLGMHPQQATITRR